MSVSLTFSHPKDLTAKTVSLLCPVPGGDNENKTIVILGDYRITLNDFCTLAEYVLSNTDLDSDRDPRLKLVERVKDCKVCPGSNPGGVRLELF